MFSGKALIIWAIWASLKLNSASASLTSWGLAISSSPRAFTIFVVEASKLAPVAIPSRAEDKEVCTCSKLNPSGSALTICCNWASVNPYSDNIVLMSSGLAIFKAPTASVIFVTAASKSSPTTIPSKAVAKSLLLMFSGKALIIWLICDSLNSNSDSASLTSCGLAIAKPPSVSVNSFCISSNDGPASGICSASRSRAVWIWSIEAVEGKTMLSLICLICASVNVSGKAKFSKASSSMVWKSDLVAMLDSNIKSITSCAVSSSGRLSSSCLSSAKVTDSGMFTAWLICCSCASVNPYSLSSVRMSSVLAIFRSLIRSVMVVTAASRSSPTTMPSKASAKSTLFKPSGSALIIWAIWASLKLNSARAVLTSSGLAMSKPSKALLSKVLISSKVGASAGIWSASLFKASWICSMEAPSGITIVSLNCSIWASVNVSGNGKSSRAASSSVPTSPTTSSLNCSM